VLIQLSGQCKLQCTVCVLLPITPVPSVGIYVCMLLLYYCKMIYAWLANHSVCAVLAVTVCDVCKTAVKGRRVRFLSLVTCV
jgi:hypothetical protein